MAAPDQPTLGAILLAIIMPALTVIGACWRMVSSKASKEELEKVMQAFEKSNAAALQRIDEHYDEARLSRERLYDKLDQFTDAIDTRLDNLNKDVGATMIALSGIKGRLDESDRLTTRSHKDNR